jgi:hypothetical protein
MNTLKQLCRGLILVLLMSVAAMVASAQCSICTKTAAQLGEKTGQGINAAVIYLAATPLLIAGLIGYKWWKNNR